MRVASVSFNNYVSNNKRVSVKKNDFCPRCDSITNTQFKGKTGQFVGCVVGAGAAVVASFALSPLILLSGPCFVLGAAAGDATEDVLKNKTKDKSDSTK